MSSFFGSWSNRESAVFMEREMRDEERQHTQRVRSARMLLAIAIAGVVVLGGAYGAYAATHTPKSQPEAAALSLPTPAKSKAKSKSKHKKSKQNTKHKSNSRKA